MSPLSVWNAASAGLSADEMIGTLERFSRFDLPKNVVRDVRDLHARFGRLRLTRADDGPDDLPISFRGEYLKAGDDSRNATTGAITELKRDGFYLTALYTLDKLYQFGVRYDEINNNKDVDGNRIKTFTAGFHYLVKGKNINLKLDYFSVKQENRRVNNVLDETYSQFVLAAQVAF